MKRWIKLLVVIGAGAYLVKRLKPKTKLSSSSVMMQDPVFKHQSLTHASNTNLSDTLVQSFKVQVKAVMSAYPSDKTVDVIHRVSFSDFNALHRFIQVHAQLQPEDDVELLEVILCESTSSDAQTVLDAIVAMAQSAQEHQATYLSFSIENLR
jgi:hypothetical protein